MNPAVLSPGGQGLIRQSEGLPQNEQEWEEAEQEEARQQQQQEQQLHQRNATVAWQSSALDVVVAFIVVAGRRSVSRWGARGS